MNVRSLSLVDHGSLSHQIWDRLTLWVTQSLLLLGCWNCAWNKSRDVVFDCHHWTEWQGEFEITFFSFLAKNKVAVIFILDPSGTLENANFGLALCSLPTLGTMVMLGDLSWKCGSCFRHRINVKTIDLIIQCVAFAFNFDFYVGKSITYIS